MGTFRDTTEQERFFQRSQIDRYTHLYHATFLVPYFIPGSVELPTLRSAILQVEEDSDFHITHMIGAVQDTAAWTEVNEPTFAMAGVTGSRADRGLDLKIHDPGSGRTLTKASNSRNITLEGEYIPFVAMFAPGYAFNYREPIPFDYFIERKRRLILDVRLRQTANEEVADLPSVRVTFGFLGHRVMT